MRRKYLERMTNLVVILALIVAIGGIGLFPQTSMAATFTENFSTTTYKDNANTSADWNTSSGKLKLPQLGWTKADGVTPGYDNVSNNSATSNYSQIALDANGMPNVVWKDWSIIHGDIFFSRWNSNQWTKANGSPGYDNISNNSGDSWFPRIVLDANQRPNIVWVDSTYFTTGNMEIFFSRWSGTAWTKVDGTPGYDIVSKDSDISWNPQIVLDANQRPNLVWEKMPPLGGSGEIVFSRWNGASWTRADGAIPGFDNISNNAGASEFPHLLLDTNQKPNIVWNDNTDGDYDIYFSKYVGPNWTKADGVTAGYDNLSNNAGFSWTYQLVLDASQKPNVVWDDNTLGNFDIFFSKWNGLNWTRADNITSGFDNISNSSGDSFHPQFKINTNNKPNIVWADSSTGNWDIFFSMWNGTAWTKADGTTQGYDNISHNSGASDYPQMFLDSSQSPHIVWQDLTPGNFDIFYSFWIGSSWSKANGTSGYDNISQNSGDSLYPQIIIGGLPKPNVVWEDSTPGKSDIFFSKYSGNFLSPKQAQSISLNPTKAIISKATLTATHTLNGGIINYYLSADGGVHWETVTSGVEHTFANKGNGLRWKAVLSSSNPLLTPEIDSLSVNYTFSKFLKRLYGDTRYETAVAISKEGWPSGADTVIITRGDLFPDALAGAPLSAKYHAPILLTWPSELKANVADEIKRLKATQAIILGSEDAICPKVSEQLTSQCAIAKNKITRIGGATRYETSAMISGYLKPLALKTAFVATGENFPDALSAASIASCRQIPILLVRGDISLIPETVKNALKDLGITQTLIAGQTDVVPQAIQGWLNANNYHPQRLGGDTRYDTCRAIADYGVANLGISLLVGCVPVGENFPDALTLGPLAGKNQAAILLIRTEFIPDSIKTFINTHKTDIYQIYIAGGPDVVSQAVENEIKQILGI